MHLIRTKEYKRTDDWIRDDICERLTHHWPDDASLNVEVKDGKVTLTGEVFDRRMKHMTGDAVEEVTGVKEIHNKLCVTRDRAA